MILCTDVGNHKLSKQWKTDTSSLFTTLPNHSLPSVAWGKNTHWYIDMQNTAISKRQGNVFWTPHQAQVHLRVGANPCSAYLIIPKTCLIIIIIYQPRRCSENLSVCNSTAKHTAMQIGKTGQSVIFFKNGPKIKRLTHSNLYSEAILSKVECAVCIPEFASPENAGVGSTKWPEWSD